MINNLLGFGRFAEEAENKWKKQVDLKSSVYGGERKRAQRGRFRLRSFLKRAVPWRDGWTVGFAEFQFTESSQGPVLGCSRHALSQDSQKFQLKSDFYYQMIKKKKESSNKSFQKPEIAWVNLLLRSETSPIWSFYCEAPACMRYQSFQRFDVWSARFIDASSEKRASPSARLNPAMNGSSSKATCLLSLYEFHWRKVCPSAPKLCEQELLRLRLYNCAVVINVSIFIVGYSILRFLLHL